MARNEQNREDLWAEARALVIRAEIMLNADGPQSASESPIVAGFRADGSASFFFGHDYVYHFNAAGAWRRGFLGGRLIKAAAGRLAALSRHRTERESLLLRTDLSPRECDELVDQLHARLRWLDEALASGAVRLGRAAPDPETCLSHLRRWLARLPARIAIAEQPGLTR